jgi:hypothetical protein
VARSVLEDAWGRVIAVRLTPVVFNPHPSNVLSRRREELVSELLSKITALDSEELAAWAAANRAVHRTLLECRLQRERWIPAVQDGGVDMQLGLFDRRAERDALMRSALEAASAAASDERIARIERALDPGELVTAMAAVLLP